MSTFTQASKLLTGCCKLATVAVLSSRSWTAFSFTSPQQQEDPEPNDLLQSRRKTPSEVLQSHGRGSVTGRLNRADHNETDKSRRVIVCVGITGSGKSSTCNTLAGRTHKAFLLSDSMVSVTSAVSHRDYTFLGQDYRVIDTPGVGDTSRTPETIHAELTRLEGLAPHGVSAFVVVVPKGRFTEQQRAAVEEIVRLFGPSVHAYAMLAITSAIDMASTERHLLTRDELLEDLSRLPASHYLRRFVEELELRVVPVENHLDPHRQNSRFLLHQRVDDILLAHGGKPFSVQGLAEQFRRNQELEAGARDAWEAALARSLGACKQEVRRSPQGRLQLHITCDMQSP